ncbi:MAG TPA: hypothetical protein DEP72_05890 [Clostridiales bacterium]|nr:MAG: hypothetical protein A2Y18_06365 [Clostridiales bacterium GWD2_32_19]HCC07673.1 hypothetical protein [Clostridiales bacterium]
MNRLNIVVADIDKEYREALVEYIMENENERIQVASFSNKELLENYVVSNGSKIDILVVDVSFISEKVLMRVKNYVILSEKVMKDELINYDCIFKYQSGKTIIDMIFECYYTNPNNIMQSDSKKNNIYAVCSVCDNQLKTEAAMNICKSYVQKGKKVLYVSLDSFALVELYNQSSNKGLSNILFELKDKESIEKIRQYITKDKQSNIDFIAPFQNFLEYYDLTSEEVNKIVSSLCELIEYDCIVLELALDFGLVTRKVLGQVDKSVMIYNAINQEKVDKFKKNLEQDHITRELLKGMAFFSEKAQLAELFENEGSKV